MERQIQICSWVSLTLGCLLISLNLSGCTWFSDEATDLNRLSLAGEVGAEDTASVEIRPAEIANSKTQRGEINKSDYVELVWEIPSGSVEGYIIRYGLSREQMTQELKLKADEPQKITSADGIERYRYMLPNIPSDKPIYLSIAAIGPNGESAPTEVFEVPSEGRQGVTPSMVPTPLSDL